MREYGDGLLRTAVLLVGDRQAAEEAVQDAFLTAYAKIGDLQDPSKLKSWLTRIVVNRCRMKLRTWSWRRLLPFGGLETMPEGDAEPGPEDRLLLEWRNGRLADAIRKLAYPYREAITLYYFNEMSVQDIAGQLNVSANTIKARLARGRARLKRLLEEEEERGE
ncbi:RNA polymerase [Paenibacillus flagellatus]|uniref:RNA polymerase n=2 Tax=Paenibacillus flagellatus TaxID=2211139 RepID=A0A2V5KEK1_9BACL|nr:RNA polymerase [Paenibacillus flagellatus]